MAMDNDGKFRGFAFVEFENEVGSAINRRHFYECFRRVMHALLLTQTIRS